MTLHDLYRSHLTRIVDMYKNYLGENNFSEAWIHYGDHERFFNDDQEKNFRANPFAIHIVSEAEAVGSWIRITKDGQVTLFNSQDLGFWNVPTSIDFTFFKESGLVEVVDFDANEKYPLLKAIKANLNSALVIGPNPATYVEYGFSEANINPKELILDHEELRLVKTDYEYELLCQAQYLGIQAHRALKNAVFNTQFSENQLLNVYLQVAKMAYDKQGYNSIIAYNRNAAILHYNVLDFEQPKEKKGFLVDAGATYKGYQADISRTYCVDGNELFDDLILGVGNIKDDIMATMRPGVKTSDLQRLMYDKTSELLLDAELLKDVSIEEAFELGIPQKFVPHGFGHSMGIGVHDVMGRPKLPRVPGARATHELQVGNVWTIEPGIYFIDELLGTLKDDAKTASKINWELLDTIYDHGGIRVEDNVMLQEDQLVNLTGDLDNK